MDAKTITVLEYGKVTSRLAEYASFSASADLARNLQPITDFIQIQILHKETKEGLLLLDSSDFQGIGAAHDVRNLVERAQRGGVLEPTQIQEVKDTLVTGRDLYKQFEHKNEAYPRLLDIIHNIRFPLGLIEQIGRILSDRAEILDSASPALSKIRAEIKVNHERLFSKLQKIIGDSKTAPMLQEAIITQRDGRFVVPLRAEFKGQLRSIIHDQSSSGATLFVEPLIIVEMNNRVRELALEERNEIHRLLAELSRNIGECAGEISGIVDALAAFDLAIMRAKYALELKAVEPLLLTINSNSDTSQIKLLQARHPLLEPEKVVAIDVLFEPSTTCMVITGPNTGGKTVTLKTVGLLVMMAQSGMFIPAQSGSELGIYKDIFADIGDEQSIEQSLSTFSGHIKNLVHILQEADQNSLVLLDELGAGTDPQEGSTLARSILEYLLEKRITSLVATHFPELKMFAYTHAGTMNASLEFNLRTLKPTYHLILGIPGRSNALVIAERLGMPEEIIRRARAAATKDDKQTDSMLEEINRQREASKKVLSSTDRMRTEVEKMQRQLAEKLAGLDEERNQIISSARLKVQQAFEEIMDEIDNTRKELAKARQPLDRLAEIRKSTETIGDMIQAYIPVPSNVQPISNITAQGRYKPGDKVFVNSLKMQAVVLEVHEDEVEVQFGSLRARTSIDDIRVELDADLKEEKNRKSVKVTRTEKPVRPTVFRESPGMELNIRGKRVDEAEVLVERYLESAYMAHLPFARILHGKGTGTLRQVVQELLMASPYVDNWELASEKEGGAGVTVVKFRND